MAKFSKENRIGLLITVVFHLIVIIIALVYQIDATLKREEIFVLDFTKQEELERREQLEKLETEVSGKVDALISRALATSNSNMRNIAVNAGDGQLKDDRGTNVDELYKEAAKVQERLKSEKGVVAIDDSGDIGKEKVQVTETKKGPEYSGPSVLSYDLGGRRGIDLKIPAYKCYGEGKVSVAITVNRAGQVINAAVIEGVSSDDPCLRSFAIRAARLSLFESSNSAPERHQGTILYGFIAQ